MYIHYYIEQYVHMIKKIFTFVSFQPVSSLIKRFSCFETDGLIIVTRRVLIESARSTSAEFHLKKRSESLGIDRPLNGCKLTRAKTGGLVMTFRWLRRYNGSSSSAVLHVFVMLLKVPFAQLQIKPSVSVLGSTWIYYSRGRLLTLKFKGIGDVFPSQHIWWLSNRDFFLLPPILINLFVELMNSSP